MSDNIKTFTRQELYELVWSKPITKILKENNITNKSFKDICQKNEIPLPKTGYWSKLRHNVPVEIIKLPNESDNCAISIGDDSFSNSNSPQAKLSQLKKQLLKDSKLNFTVSNNLSKPDRLIISAKKGMEVFQKNRYFHKGGIISTIENQISISVAKENIPRSLRFMDAFVKLVKKRGHSIEIGRTTIIVVNKQKIEVRFREIMKRARHPKYSWISEMPSGILSFRIDSFNGKEWRDSAKIPIETRLIDILAKLELVSKEMEEYQIKLERGWAEQRERREVEEKIKHRLEKEILDFKSLINSSGRWHKSVSLRNYLDAFEAKAKENNTLDEKKIEWLKWARKKADWYDPFVESEDELFKNVDRDSI